MTATAKEVREKKNFSYGTVKFQIDTIIFEGQFFNLQ